MKRRRFRMSDGLALAIVGLCLLAGALIDGGASPGQALWIMLIAATLVGVMWFFVEIDK